MWPDGDFLKKLGNVLLKPRDWFLTILGSRVEDNFNLCNNVAFLKSFEIMTAVNAENKFF